MLCPGGRSDQSLGSAKDLPSRSVKISGNGRRSIEKAVGESEHTIFSVSGKEERGANPRFVSAGEDGGRIWSMRAEVP